MVMLFIEIYHFIIIKATWFIVLSNVHVVPGIVVLSSFIWHPVAVVRIKLLGNIAANFMFPTDGL